jgi:hypothetical protein
VFRHVNNFDGSKTTQDGGGNITQLAYLASQSQLPRILMHEISSSAHALDRGFEFQSSHGYLPTFFMFVLPCVGSGLETD